MIVGCREGHHCSGRVWMRGVTFAVKPSLTDFVTWHSGVPHTCHSKWPLDLLSRIATAA